MDIKNKNELKRRIDLFLHDFTPEEYKINEEFCKETMRMMADFIGHVDNRLDSANAKVIAGRKRETNWQNTSSKSVISARSRLRLNAGTVSERTDVRSVY